MPKKTPSALRPRKKSRQESEDTLRGCSDKICRALAELPQCAYNWLWENKGRLTRRIVSTLKCLAGEV